MLVLGKKFEKGSNKRIKKFTYETRTTSRDFCKGLTNETIVIRDDKKITDVDVAGITDWRKYFITVPEIMDSLHKYTDGRASERYVRFEGKYIFLMGSTRLYGWNEEYYSYALYCLLKKLPNASVKYNQAKGWEDVDCHIELTSSTNAGKWKIKYLRAKDKFSVIDASGVQSLYSTVEDAKYALEKLL